jgi:FkbH-like protein
MKLVEALELANRSHAQAKPKSFFLACGFSPLHLRTFLHAHLQKLFPTDAIDLCCGLYGDLAGSMERASACTFDSAAVVLEWADIDPRLGIRQLGGWLPETLPDILSCVDLSLVRLESALAGLLARCPVALSLPTLPLPPLDFPPGFQAGTFELDLRLKIAGFAARISGLPVLRLVHPQRLDILSPLAGRLDAKSELSTGFPYRLEHAEKLASLLASLLHNASPKKGLITDLDDTCWKGILGEVGVDGICWDLDGRGHLHGLYQQFLHALAARGVLIAVASKNDPALVQQAFERPDIHLPPGSVFPIQAHWGPKSQSVARILKTWNIAADSVVFVDDSPLELAEVRTFHPDVECIQFPAHDPDALLGLLERLRDLFGKPALAAEDRLRSQSIRAGAALQDAVLEGVPAENILKQADARIQFHLNASAEDARAFDLVNKTNQFNLNGRRFRDVEWRAYLQQEGAFLLTVSYRDKFGPLGEIAVILGRALPSATLRIDAWVMSCRAFSRRSEHQCLSYLFRKFDAGTITFDWVETPRNGPLGEFLEKFQPLQPDFRLERERFEALCPPLFHIVEEPVL